MPGVDITGHKSLSKYSEALALKQRGRRRGKRECNREILEGIRPTVHQI